MKKIFATALIFLSLSCGDKPSSSVPKDVQKAWNTPGIPLADNVKQTTTKGVLVWSRNGLSQQHLDQVDEALTELFADVNFFYPGQVTNEVVFNYSDWDIYEPDHDCIPSPEQRIPSFYVRDTSLDYDGSEFDQYNSKGYGVKDQKSVVMASERVFSYPHPLSTPRRARMLVCPDLAAWKNNIRYGAEHIVADSADVNTELLQLAVDNRTHSTGGHPFIRSRP